jgi:hypothetical protein
MLGEFSEGRARSLAKGIVRVSSATGRGTVAGLRRRLRVRDAVPASGQIVFRAGSQTLR